MRPIEHRAGPYHVAHVIASLQMGGAERQLVNYLLAADRQEFKHTVVCLSRRGELAEQVEEAGIPVVVVRMRSRYAPACLWRLARWLRREEAAVVHTHMHRPAMWGRLAGRMAGVPVLVTTEHGKELWKNRLQVALDQLLSRWTSRHIAVSRDGMEIRLRRERVAPERILLIPNGVPIPDDPENAGGRRRIRDEFGLGPDQPVIGSVGRVIAAKGYSHLLEALKILRTQTPGLRWLAVGDGDSRATLASRAVELGVADTVIWTGARSDVGDLLAAMDLWVMSSVREGLPVALLEAMAARKPIVATRVGGIPDAVNHGSEALLVPPENPGELAKAITTLLQDPQQASTLAAAARQRAAAEYSIASVAGRIEGIYREELSKRRVLAFASR